MNNVTLVGRMVYEPEIKTTKNGTNYLPMRIAVSRNDKEKTTDFISARAWGKTAEFISKYFKKGDPIEIIGKLQVDNYEKSDGTKASETYILVSEAGFVIQRSNKTEQHQAPVKEEGNAGLPFEI